MYSIIHSIYISSHIIPHHYICYDETGNKCNAGLTGRPVLYTEPINWPRVNFRNKKKKKKKKNFQTIMYILGGRVGYDYGGGLQVSTWTCFSTLDDHLIGNPLWLSRPPACLLHNIKF